MLTIDRSSWHLRLCRSAYGQSYTPNNLCKYFWSVLGAPLVKIMVLLLTGLAAPFVFLGVKANESDLNWGNIGTVMGIGVVVLGTIWGLLVIGYVVALAAIHWDFWAFTLLLIIPVLALLVLAIHLSLEWLGKRVETWEPKPKKAKSPSFLSLAWQFVKAKKKRVCPLIFINQEDYV